MSKQTDLLNLTDAITVDSSNNVGIGTSSPDDVLHVVTPSFGGITLECTGATADPTFKFLGDSGNYWSLQQDASQGDSFQFRYNNSEKIRIDASGNVGIGVTPPAWSVVGPALTVDNASLASYSAGNIHLSYLYNNIYYDGANEIYEKTGKGALFQMNGDNFVWFNAPSGTAGATATLSERMRIDSSGNLLVGTTSLPSSGSGGVGFQPTTASRTVILCSTSVSTAAGLIAFLNPNGTVGTISTNGSSTAYNTSSDYRLKTDAQPMTGASARVQALKPVNFEWIADGTRVDGFLAHEAQEVVPEAVHGTKDAMRDEQYEVTPAVYEDVVIPAVLDEEGNELEAERTEQRLVSEAVMGTRSVPDYQGIDQSKLVPLLTAALQEALTEIADLKARVTALEAV